MDDLQMLCAGAGDSFAVHFAAFKVCKYCGKELSPSNFFKSGCQSLTARCKQCHGLGQRTCRICGRSFIGKTGQIFCSEACRKTHRPQTFKSCAHCENIFGPVSHLSTRYCSVACKNSGQRKALSMPRQSPTNKARAAHTAIARAIKAKRIQRPEACSECGLQGRIEAAHHNYHEPLKVRWLCRSCHAKWDWAVPKGGTLEGLYPKNLAVHTPVARDHAENANI